MKTNLLLLDWTDLDAVEIDVELCEPRLGVLGEDDAGHVDAGEGDLIGRVQQRHVRPQGVVNHPPRHRQHRLLGAKILRGM